MAEVARALDRGERPPELTPLREPVLRTQPLDDAMAKRNVARATSLAILGHASRATKALVSTGCIDVASDPAPCKPCET
jgi:hypothetical protein